MKISKSPSGKSLLPPFYHGISNDEIFPDEKCKEIKISLSVLATGGMSDMHIHRNARHYYLMIEGELLVKAGKEEVVITNEECVMILAGEPHQVMNVGKGMAKYYVVSLPYTEDFVLIDDIDQTGF